MQPQIFKDKVDLTEIKKLAEESYGDMAKAVVDLRREIIIVGGEFHADAEAILLSDGSRQEDLWGINFYPKKTGEEFIEYNSLINIRPKAGNRGVNIEIQEIRAKIKALIDKKIELC